MRDLVCVLLAQLVVAAVLVGHHRREDVAVEVAARAKGGPHVLDDRAEDRLEVLLEHAMQLSWIRAQRRTGARDDDAECAHALVKHGRLECAVQLSCVRAQRRTGARDDDAECALASVGIPSP